MLSCVLLSTWTVLMVTLEGVAWTSAPLWSQVMVEEGQLSTVQLKETGAGEVTVWLADMAVTIGGTDEEVAQRKEREGIIYALCKHPSPLHTTNSLNNWHLHVHLTLLLLPIAGGTNGGHCSIQAQCVVAAFVIY